MKLDDLRRDLVKPRTPTRFCQAMNDLSPSHRAEVVVTGEDGRSQWFSCRAHVPKSATRAEGIDEWSTRHGIALGLGEVDPVADELGQRDQSDEG